MKKKLREKKANERETKGRWATALVGLLVLVVFCVLLSFAWGGRVTNSDFEGTIVDRWSDYAETQQGSYPRLALVVESSDGKRFTVRVDPTVYESAKVGMRIKSKSGQVVLIDSERNR